MNLCINARDAMDGNGVLTLATENILIDGRNRETHPWSRPGRHVRLTVSDTGHGMPAEVRDRVFEPFFTTKDDASGSGLGLAMVYGIVQQHGGTIHVHSDVGLGTRIEVFLPAIEEPASEIERIRSTPARGGDETILVAEDDAAVRGLVRVVLERGGYEVLEADNGEVALNVFERHRATIDLIIIDAVMPVMGGRELHNRVAALAPDLPTVFISGYSTEALPSEFIADNGLRVIAKPFEADVLLRAVRLMLDDATSRQRPGLVGTPPPP